MTFRLGVVLRCLRPSVVVGGILLIFGCGDCASSNVTSPSFAVRAERPVFHPAAFIGKLVSATAYARGSVFEDARYFPEERSAARRIIAAQLREFGLSPREHRYAWAKSESQCVLEDYVRECGAFGVNIFADLPATVPTDGWVVVGAHYDTVRLSPGADDNASGVAVAMAVADALTRLPTRRLNVVFAFFDQEEEGLIGSAHLASWLAADGRTVVAANIFDMVGWDADGDGVAELIRVGSDELWETNGWLIGAYVHASLGMRVRIPGSDGASPSVLNVVRSNVCRSDHCSFLRQGVPAVQIAEEMVGGDSNPNYHGMSDTSESLNVPYLLWIVDLAIAATVMQVGG